MQCIAPITIKRDGQVNTVPCGRCAFCLANKQADWSFRLQQELRGSTGALFVTLTYSDHCVPVFSNGLPTLWKEDVQRFLKRLRKTTTNKLRYYCVGEYGSNTMRPHYHMILFNYPIDQVEMICDEWQLGNVHLGDVTGASIHYTTKYVITKWKRLHGRNPNFAIMSRRPGIGIGYVDTFSKWHRKHQKGYCVLPGGFKHRMPRYYKEKIFSKFERSVITALSLQQYSKIEKKQIQALKKFHSDPYKYHNDRITQRHEKILQLSIKNDKL